MAESFFATIKGEMIDHEDYETRAQAIAAIADYIDAFYNVTRLHSAIGYVSPIEFEMNLRWLALDHRAGFLLSQLDGRSTFEELLDVCGMPPFEAIRLLVQLLQQNVIRVV